MAERKSSDHDLLIEVNVKLEQLITTVDSLREGTHAKIKELDKRVDITERWQNDFDVRWKLVVGVVGAFSILVTTVATLVIQYVFKLFTGG